MTKTHDMDETQSSHIDVDRLLEVLMDDLRDPDATKPPRVESASKTANSLATEHRNRRTAQLTPNSQVPDRVRQLFSMDTAEVEKALFGNDPDSDAKSKTETAELAPVHPAFVPDAVTDEFESLSEHEKRMQLEDKWLAEQRIRLHMEKMVLEEQARRLMIEERLMREQATRLALERRIEMLEAQLDQEKSKMTNLIDQMNAEQNRRALTIKLLRKLEDHLIG